MTQPKLELINLVKEYENGDVIAVDSINLTVETGETIALLGSSGCGKSTTLNMIVGLEQPTSGDIRIDGQSIVNVPAGKRNVGLVFQDYAVFTAMSVRKNLAFGLEVRKTPKAEIDRAVDEVAELLGMKDKLDAHARELGGSELQRVAIGRTLVTRPSILLLDEPLSNLETAARHAMRQELRRLQSEIGLTIIYVTHDQVEALSLADRIAVMNAGHILQVEKTAVICEQPHHVYVAGFLGSPPMNLSRGKFATQGDTLVFRTSAFTLPLCAVSALSTYPAEHAFSLGIKPERVILTAPDAGMLSGTVTMAEPRGHESVLSIDVHGEAFKIVVPVADHMCEGTTVGLNLPGDALTFFDGETNTRVNILPEERIDA